MIKIEQDKAYNSICQIIQEEQNIIFEKNKKDPITIKIMLHEAELALYKLFHNNGQWTKEKYENMLAFKKRNG